MLEPEASQRILPGALGRTLERLRGEWAKPSKLGRLWAGDESLWTSSGESEWLGWLDLDDPRLVDLDRLESLAADARRRFSHAVLLGMGGSSLCPEVLRKCFGARAGHPDLRVLDSTAPEQLQACESALDIESTLFISASKSGSTLETKLLTEHFFDRVSGLRGRSRAGSQFLAITDPGSQLERIAGSRSFSSVLHGVPSIGGRYSALSHFGMAPAAVMGIDVARLMDRARAMSQLCGPGLPARLGPGADLGLLLGVAALSGRDKLMLFPSPSVAALGAWIEQLLAESTGKLGRGIVPVDGGRISEAGACGPDRLLIRITRSSDSEPQLEESQAWQEAVRDGHPIAEIRLQSLYDLGGEFYRWEVATAVAGSVLGINPFDQPDVESAKVAARQITDRYEREGAIAAERPRWRDSSTRVYSSREGDRGADAAADLPSLLQAHLGSLRPGDYCALLAFLPSNAVTRSWLDRMRRGLQQRFAVATCAGFGPRYLHSTGQLHKGGPNSGLFLMVSREGGDDVPVAGRSLSFGVVKESQAAGDYEVLCGKGRRVMRVVLTGSLERGLAKLEEACLGPQ